MPGSAFSAKNQVQAGLADKILILEVQKWSESFRTDPVFQDMAACAVNRWNSSPHAELGWVQGCTGQYSVCPGVPLKQSCQAQDRVWYFSFSEFSTVALETAGAGSGEGAVAVWRSQGFIVHFGEEKPQSSQSECAARMCWGRSFQCRHPGVAAATADASGAALATGMFFLGSSAKVWIRPPSSTQPLASPLNALEQTLH